MTAGPPRLGWLDNADDREAARSAQARTLGFYLLADLALGLVRAQTGQPLDDLVRELTLLVAATPPPPPG